MLSREERDVLLLFAWADLSYEQIAEALRVADRHRALAAEPGAHAHARRTDEGRCGQWMSSRC